ncbi:MAG: DUF6644 family protein [Steroidobacteraceae bacterium]
MVRELADWIQSTRLNHVVRDATWLVPTSQAIHIVCVAIVLGSTIMISFRLLGVMQPTRSVAQLVDTLIPWMLRAVAVLLLTGVVQTVAEPRRELLAGVFWLKMAMVLCAVIVTVWFATTVRRNTASWSDAGGTRIPAQARIFALVSLVLWAGIVICGRLIAYSWLLHPQRG